MEELISIITSEIQKTRFGIIQLNLTMHEGQIRCVNVTTTKKHNITPKTKQESGNGKGNWK